MGRWLASSFCFSKGPPSWRHSCCLDSGLLYPWNFHFPDKLSATTWPSQSSWTTDEPVNKSLCHVSGLCSVLWVMLKKPKQSWLLWGRVLVQHTRLANMQGREHNRRPCDHPALSELEPKHLGWAWDFIKEYLTLWFNLSCLTLWLINPSRVGSTIYLS